MKPIVLAGIVLMILAPIAWLLGPFAMMSGSILGIILIYGLAIVLFIIGFLLIISTVISERMEEIKKEKGKYKQYEEEDD